MKRRKNIRETQLCVFEGGGLAEWAVTEVDLVAI